jgi:hypothetical protein
MNERGWVVAQCSAAEITEQFVILSGVKNLSRYDEILRCAQNDKC